MGRVHVAREVYGCRVLWSYDPALGRMTSIMASDDGGGRWAPRRQRGGVVEHAPIELREREGWAVGARTVATGRWPKISAVMAKNSI